MTDKTPAEHARDAAEAIRAFNHATLDPDALPYPGDLYSAIGALHTLAQRLPQAMEQLRGRLDQFDAGGRLRHDGGDAQLADDVTSVRQWLGHAEGSAQGLADALDGAHSAAGHLGWKD